MQDLRRHFITTEDPFVEGAVTVFEQTFELKETPKEAELAITALGIYEAELDGVKVGDRLFAPGYTYYPRDLHVQVYDLSRALTPGTHTLRVYLGQGWYCGRFTFNNKCQIYGEKPAASWVLTGNGREICASDDEGVLQVESPYEYAGFYDGEIYWAEGSRETKSSSKKPVSYTGPLPEVLEECPEAVTLQEEMPVQSVIPHGDWTILDFGQNFAGVIEIDPRFMKGDCLKLRHGEILNPDGSLYTANLRKAKAQTVYHRGTETTLYRPRFTYMGFRYVELSGVPYVEGLLKARALHTQMKRTGYFHCENSDVQRLYENQLWGQKSNYIEVPTDCPQRDERMGYTGDGHVFALTGSYNFDTEEFWAKFLKDIRYSQMDNTEGYVPSTVPAQGKEGIGFLSMLGWGSCVTIVPEMLYEQYGTKKYLQEQYQSMKTYADCEIRHMGDKNLWLSPSLGDWLSPGKDTAYMAMHNGPVSNAFVVHDLETVSRTALDLGKTQEAQKYRDQLEKTRRAYLDLFVDPEGRMTDDYQGAYVMALRYVIPEGPLWERVFAHLVEDLKENGMQTGFFATAHLLPLLADHGQERLAFDLLLQPDCPGWMYQVSRGATTIWERWDALRPDGTVNETKMSSDNMVSFNHYAFGSVGAFYYRYILGIRPQKPGYSKVLIHPFVDERLGSVSGSFESRAGLIRSAWKVEGDTVSFEITTPVPTQILLPDGTDEEVNPGTYHYVCKKGDTP